MAKTTMEPDASVREHGTPFKLMTRNRKLFFALKVIVLIVSFGFIFPDVMND